MHRKEAAMPPILTAADEEARDAQLPPLRGEREHVGIAKPLRVDRLAALDEGQRFQPVADHRRTFIINRLGCAGNSCTQPILDRRRATYETFKRYRKSVVEGKSVAVTLALEGHAPI